MRWLRTRTFRRQLPSRRHRRRPAESRSEYPLSLSVSREMAQEKSPQVAPNVVRSAVTDPEGPEREIPLRGGPMYRPLDVSCLGGRRPRWMKRRKYGGGTWRGIELAGKCDFYHPWLHRCVLGSVGPDTVASSCTVKLSIQPYQTLLGDAC